MPDVLKTIFNVLVLVFVLSSMFDLGLGLTIKQIVAPLKNVPLIAKALVASFVLVPLLAFALAQVIGLEQQLAIGLFIMGVAAGSPMVVKLSQIAKGDMAYTAGLMVLLQFVTILVAPFMLTLLLDSVEVDALSLTQSLIITMLLPLVVGLFVNSRYPALAQIVSPYLKQGASVTLMMQAVLGLFLGAGDLLALVGTGAFLAAILFGILTLAIGYLLGGADQETRIVTGLSTSQRNVAAALLIMIQNFDEPTVIVMVLMTAVVMLVLGSIAAGEFGRRAASPEPVLEAASVKS
ncbi:MAG: bile acid:sodium symporter [Chloroflexota bacterium]